MVEKCKGKEEGHALLVSKGKGNGWRGITIVLMTGKIEMVKYA